jgi:methylated-DNA-[protein]-cysteine S-methyltransferase
MSKTANPEVTLGRAARDEAGRASELAASVARRAEADGLADVAYATADSPFGTLTLAATDEGLVTLGLPNLPTDQVLENLANRVSPRILQAPGRLDEARRELDLYFEGRLKSFDLPLDWRLSSGFRQRVLREIDRIPFGETRSYTEMAAGAGNPRAVRAAGSACGSNPIPIIVPCHRVLRTGGALGGYGGGLPLKKELLKLEGVL